MLLFHEITICHVVIGMSLMQHSHVDDPMRKDEIQVAVVAFWPRACTGEGMWRAVSAA